MNSIQNLEHSRSDQAETLLQKQHVHIVVLDVVLDVNVQHKAQGTMVKVAGDTNTLQILDDFVLKAAIWQIPWV
jgi:assimilatory nitrate reductase catalytic subunit